MECDCGQGSMRDEIFRPLSLSEIALAPLSAVNGLVEAQNVPLTPSEYRAGVCVQLRNRA